MIIVILIVNFASIVVIMTVIIVNHLIYSTIRVNACLHALQINTAMELIVNNVIINVLCALILLFMIVFHATLIIVYLSPLVSQLAMMDITRFTILHKIKIFAYNVL